LSPVATCDAHRSIGTKEEMLISIFKLGFLMGA
jgi:hypothetical protein